MRTIGIERERFITNTQGIVVPAIGTLLPMVYHIAREYGVSKSRFSYELFAGQIEDRTPPSLNAEETKAALLENERCLQDAAKILGLGFDHSEFVETELVKAFDVNPFDERHGQIWRTIPNERRVAASVVAAVHVHVSATGQEAVQIINRCRGDVVDRLVSIGDHSNRRRIDAYRAMAETDGVPPIFENHSAMMAYIDSKGGEKNVWDLVRYKPSTGTVEFRMFGATPSVDEILGYLVACQNVLGD
jgi:gamma-glutamyl:cysteine ligase YbdK (ATP-grasp superfamily)